MHDISVAQTKKIAFIARVGCTEEEILTIQTSLNSVMQWIDQMQNVDVEGVAPLCHPHTDHLTLLEDVAEEQDLQSVVLKNAPKARYGYFVVPKVIE